MKRAIVLSLVMLLTVGVIVPLTTDWSEASKSKVQRKRKKLKKYSRAWWRAYRAKQRRARALAARRRALAARRTAAVAAQKAGGETKTVEAATASSRGGDKKRRSTEKFVSQQPPVLGGETPVAAGGSDLQFRVADIDGRQIGSAELRVVGAAMPSNEEGLPERSRKQMLAGVPVSALRRTVIDKMIRENGWIVNDYQREVGGRKVFVVVAQTAAAGGVQSRQFYFTEVDGRIYSLSTNVPNDYSEKVAADSERALTTMLRSNRPAESADLR